jgi:S-formylglutathione hydrolase FrmB
MAICEVHLGGGALGKQVSAQVILPEGMPGPFPVMYLLHGLGDNHTVWTRRTSLERYLDGVPLIVVMPNGERGWYSDSQSHPHQAFETFITRDLIGWVDNTFQTIALREGRVIAGLSMGGYGAFKLALKYPDLFCAASSLSGAVEMHDEKAEWRDETLHQEVRAIFGDKPCGGPDDIFALANEYSLGKRSPLPALKFDCGEDDFLIEHNRHLHTHLQKLAIPHHYEEHAGFHNWDYWDAHIPATIEFFAQQLGVKR